MKTLHDIPFSREGKPHQKLDLYLPKGAGPFPAVVCYFGGAFIEGNKEDMAGVCTHLARRGMVAAAPGYALANANRGIPAWPDCVYDAKCAVRFLRANADRYGIDPARIAALGHSSGAYLALMAGLTPHVAELAGQGGWSDVSSEAAAIVNISGVVDRQASLGTGTLYLLGRGYEHDPELRRLASPLAHVGPASPPVYTLHGADDDVVEPDSARQLDTELRAAGVSHRLEIVPGAGHHPITSGRIDAIADWLLDHFKR